MIDRKLEPLVKRLMVKYLGEMEEDLIMFVLEHLKDHKGPAKLVEGLEPVRCLASFLVVTKLNMTPERPGTRGRGCRAGYQRLAAGHLRKHGVRRRSSHGKDARRLNLLILHATLQEGRCVA